MGGVKTPTSFLCGGCGKHFDCEPTSYDTNEGDGDTARFLVFFCEGCHEVNAEVMSRSKP